MFGLISSAIFVLVGSLLVGQSVLRLCGATMWDWVAGPVGISILMPIAITADWLPGRSTTTAVIVAVVVLASAVFTLRAGDQRPQIVDVLAGVPVACLVLVPFIAAGGSGVLGVSTNNDMAVHLGLAEAYQKASLSGALDSTGYPTGPHALAATLSSMFGTGVDNAFSGLSAAVPVLLGWTALAGLRSATRWGRFVACICVGAPFLVMAYYGEGAFKEVLEAALALGVAVELGRPQRLTSRFRWIPLAAMFTGALATYSVFGLIWPALILAAWLVVRMVELVPRAAGTALVKRSRAALVPVAIGVASAALLVLPQIRTVSRNVHATLVASSDGGGAGATGIPQSNLGNLVGRLPLSEAFGVWNNPDFRLGGFPPNVELWPFFVGALVGIGAIWSLNRRELILPTAVAIAVAVWAYCDKNESPYVAAKALVVLSPSLMLLAVRSLVEREPAALRTFPHAWRWLAAILAVALVFGVARSSFKALRSSRVAPQAHANELRALRPILRNGPTLWLGNDDFIAWELAGVPLEGAYIRVPDLPFRPQKNWAYGDPVDFDLVPTEELNRFDWFVTPRDSAGSVPPENVKLVRQTRYYSVWRRTGPIPPHQIFGEGSAAAAPLPCNSPIGRALSRSRGVAAVRQPPVAVGVPSVLPGKSVAVRLRLSRGTWSLTTQYTGPLPVDVSIGSLRTTLPGNLERPGPRWPVGVVRSPGGYMTALVHAHKTPLAPNSNVGEPRTLIATRLPRARIVPLSRACGKLVDWYRVEAPPQNSSG